MRVCGVDVASTGRSAVLLAVDGKPIRYSIWKPPDKRDAVADRLDQFAKWLDRQFFLMKPDIVAVEELAVFLNKTTIRELARVEGVALLRAKRYGAMVVNPSITQSRSVVFGRGNISKEQAFEAWKVMFPDFDVPARTRGGTDVVDAGTHGVAGVKILERRR